MESVKLCVVSFALGLIEGIACFGRIWRLFQRILYPLFWTVILIATFVLFCFFFLFLFVLSHPLQPDLHRKRDKNGISI